MSTFNFPFKEVQIFVLSAVNACYPVIPSSSSCSLLFLYSFQSSSSATFSLSPSGLPTFSSLLFLLSRVFFALFLVIFFHLFSLDVFFRYIFYVGVGVGGWVLALLFPLIWLV